MYVIVGLCATISSPHREVNKHELTNTSGSLNAMLYVRLHSTYFVYSVQERQEGNVLFNDALNTFLFTVIWRRTYGKVPFR